MRWLCRQLAITAGSTLISSFQLKKSYMVVGGDGGGGGGGPTNYRPITSQGLVLTLRFTCGPELDNYYETLALVAREGTLRGHMSFWLPPFAVTSS